MTQAYLRAKKPDGTWGAVEVEYLSVEQRVELFKDRSNEELLRWIDLLCVTVRTAELELNAFSAE